MNLDPLCRRLLRFYRACGWVIGILLAVSGVYLFVHDLLIVLHTLPPDNPEGPYGVIAGPILAIAVGGLLFWLRYTKQINVNDD